MPLLDFVARSAGMFAFLTMLSTSPLAAQQNATQMPTPTNTQQAIPAQPGGILQISGTAERFNALADRASLPTVLTLLFEQAGKDFVLDNDLTGSVTMRLTGQSFETALRTVCAQTFLRYRIDPATGVYHFTHDDDAVRAAFTRLRTLNAQLHDQLRIMGLEVPNFGYSLGLNNAYNTQSLNTNLYGRQNVRGPGSQDGGFGGTGGFAGGAPASEKLEGSKRAAAGGGVRVEKIGGNSASDTTASPHADAKDVLRESGGGRGASQKSAQDNALQKNAPAIESNASQTAAPQNLAIIPDSYQQFRAQNGLVELHVPKGQEMPVRDAIQNLGVQANVPILFDPSVPEGSRFRMTGTISARSLPEALNILAPTARLEWKLIGDRIFITTSSDFQIFYGESNVPRATFGPGGSQVPAQTPADKPAAPPLGRATDQAKKAPPKSKKRPLPRPNNSGSTP